MAKRDWNALSQAAAGAALKESKPAIAQADAIATKKKQITVPIRLEQAFTDAKLAGRVTGDFAGYIIEALRERLERDGFLETH